MTRNTRIISKTTAALVALALVLSVLGPVGTVAAVEGITVDQQADSTTVNPGDTITFTTDVGVDETQIDAASIGLQTNVQQGALPGWEVTSRSNVNNFIPGPDGFLWFAPNGVSGSATAQYTVSVPDDAEPGDYEVAVTASTEGGASTTDTTTITVEAEDTNTAPDADAGDDQTVDEDTQVTLDAAGSSDPDGDDLTYSWTQTGGTDVSLSGADTATPTFTAPTLTESETLTFEVTVSDGQASDTDTVSVTVNPVNAQPTASISGPTSAQVGEEVTFTASASDSDGSIASYSWDIDGDTATGDSVAYTFDSAGDYTVELTVTDDEGATATATQTVSVGEAPDPASFQVSNLDAPSTATQGDTVTVSADVENTGDEEATQTVEFVFDGDVVDSEDVTLASGASDTVEFTLDTTDVDAGTYTHGVYTEDDQATAQITVEEPAPEPEPDPANFEVSNLDAPSTATQGDTVTVSADVENTGDEEATQTVEFSFDGSVVDSEDVTLASGASDTVEFTLDTTDVDAGTYTHGVSTANDSATAEITVEEPAPEPDPASFAVSGLTVDPGTATVGESVTVSATVENTGNEEGTQTVALSVDGTQVDSEEVTLASGASQTVEFTYDTTGVDAGDYDVTVASDDDSATGSLTVEAAEEPEEPPEDDEKHKLVFKGDGAKSTYEFSVSGEVLDGEKLEGEDSYTNASGSGAVWDGWTDAYVYTGDLDDVSVTGGADVYVDGEKLDSAEYDRKNKLVFKGDGAKSTYEFSVSGEVLDGEKLEGEDSYTSTSGSGAVWDGWTDAYVFTGDPSEITVTGGADVYLNGEKVDVSEPDRKHKLVFKGDGAKSTYEFSVSGEVLDGEKLEDEDSYTSTSGSGAVWDGWTDAYVFTGDLDDVHVDGGATVYVDGEKYTDDEDDDTHRIGPVTLPL